VTLHRIGIGSITSPARWVARNETHEGVAHRGALAQGRWPSQPSCHYTGLFAVPPYHMSIHFACVSRDLPKTGISYPQVQVRQPTEGEAPCRCPEIGCEFRCCKGFGGNDGACCG
jgi:hypothetical protein